MIKIALITCLMEEDPSFLELQNDLNERFNPKKTIVEFFHAGQSYSDIINILKTGATNIPIKIGFDCSCDIKRIGETMRNCREQLPEIEVEFYYNKNVDETLTPSLQRFGCFKALVQKHTDLVVA